MPIVTEHIGGPKDGQGPFEISEEERRDGFSYLTETHTEDYSAHERPDGSLFALYAGRRLRVTRERG